MQRIRSFAIVAAAILAATPACLAFSLHAAPLQARSTASATALFASAEDESAPLDRRSVLQQSAAAMIGIASASVLTPAAFAAEDDDAATPKSIVVVGATGQTGRRILERLAAQQQSAPIIGGVRNVDKATAALTESSTVLRGAMVQKVNAVNTNGVTLQHMDVVKDSDAALAQSFQNADAVVIAVGFIPGNPLKWNQGAHDVDNVGTCRLVDAARAAGVRKIVLVSSILTNGRNWGQEKAPGFVITNAFGGVLDEKIIAEKYLRASGMDYTIVRAGGLKSNPPTGPVIISGEDTLNSGEVSRDLVADVSIASIFDPKASNKVLEIIEDDGKPPQAFNGLVM